MRRWQPGEHRVALDDRGGGQDHRLAPLQAPLDRAGRRLVVRVPRAHTAATMQLVSGRKAPIPALLLGLALPPELPTCPFDDLGVEGWDRGLRHRHQQAASAHDPPVSQPDVEGHPRCDARVLPNLSRDDEAPGRILVASRTSL
jgi:hypothetical protein